MRAAEVYESGQDTDQDQQDMPQVGVDGQRGQRVVETAGVCEDGDASQERVGHKECEQDPPGAFPAEPRVKEKEIHGDAAELEREIPPVVTASAEYECQGELFPYLADGHDDSAQEKQYI